jgi:hypothetical protein
MHTKCGEKVMLLFQVSDEAEIIFSVSPLGLLILEQAALIMQNPRLQRQAKNHNFIADVKFERTI